MLRSLKEKRTLWRVWRVWRADFGGCRYAVGVDRHDRITISFDQQQDDLR